MDIITLLLGLAARWDQAMWTAVSVVDEVRSEQLGRVDDQACEDELEPYYVRIDVAERLRDLYQRRADRLIERDDAVGRAIELIEQAFGPVTAVTS